MLALAMGLACTPASMVIRYNASLAMAARKFKTAYMPDFLFRPSLLLFAILLVAGLGWLTTAGAALLLFVAVTYATAVLQFYALGHTWSGQAKGIISARFKKGLRYRAVALTLVSATMLAFADIVVVVAGMVLPPEQVAIAGVAIRLAAIAGFVLQAAQMLVVTDFTEAHVRGQKQQAHTLLKKTNNLTMAVVLAGLLGTFLLGRIALGLFGPAYQAGYDILLLLMVGQSLRALGGMNQQLLSIHGHQMRTAGSCVLALLVLVCSSVILTPSFGMTGMGLAVVAAELVWLLALASQAQHLCGQRGDVLWVWSKR
jgi:O-antigen/teichoic acid export membrane protein